MNAAGAVELRGFTLRGPQSSNKSRPFADAVDVAAMAACAALVALAVALRLL